MRTDVKNIFDLDLPIADWAHEEGIADEEMHDRLLERVDAAAARKAAELGPQLMRQIEKAVVLQTLDHLWREHLLTLEHLRQVVGLRGYGQRDPLNEYKSEAFTLFESMIERMREAVTGQLMHIELASQPPELDTELPPMAAHHVNPLTGEDEFDAPPTGSKAGNRAAGARPGNGAPPKNGAVQAKPRKGEANPSDPSTWGKVARNAACPCGSGKKYKHCHGALVEHAR